MKQYLDLLKFIKSNGSLKEAARAGMPGTVDVFGYMMRFNLQEGFPLMTTKKMGFKFMVTELLWFLRGDTNIKYLVDNKCNIWNEDAHRWYKSRMRAFGLEDENLLLSLEQFIENIKNGHLYRLLNTEEELGYESFVKTDGYKLGDLGPTYAEQWRRWPTDVIVNMEGLKSGKADTPEFKKVDQIANVLKMIAQNPYGRRNIVTAWNPAEVDNLALPPCHAIYQFNCRKMTLDERFINWQNASGVSIYYFDNYRNEHSEEGQIKYLDSLGAPTFALDCLLFQRSCDVFLGVPTNIASYALLTTMFAKVLGMAPGEFVWTGGSVHIYEDHMEAVNTQLQNDPKPLPTIKFLKGVKSLDDLLALTRNDIILENYQSHGEIKAKLSVGI